MNSESSALTMNSPAIINQCARGGMEEEKVWPKQQQQNNISLFPSTKSWNFRGKKRKQSTQDEDTISICSLDTSEPSNKRVKPLSRVTSLASLIPPVRATPLKRFSQTLQRSISFRSDSRPDLFSPRPWSRSMPPANTKRRDSKLWSETFDVCVNHMLTSKEIKRQEAIFELTQGEEDLIEDLKLAKKAYHDPMLKLSIMTEQELNQIFGTLDSLIPLHEDLLRRLQEVRKSDGSTEHVGHILVDWLPCLNSYDSYCSNQVAAKALLDHKKQDHRVQDFLQRCLESPFSRKLDLWHFLDIPRSRLVKYPLLLREILRHTPNDHPDQQHLEEAINIIQGIVADINIKTGESECQYYKERLIYLEEGQRDSLIDNSRVLCCHGELKNNKGVKLHVFLFQEVMVITRAITHNEQLCYQLYRQPIPIRDLLLEELQDGEVRLGGSIRGAFSNNERIRNFFRVSFKHGSQSQSHSLQANDSFNKQQWLNCIRQAKEKVTCAGKAGELNSEAHFILSPNGSRVSQGETTLEQMDQSDSESDCSMDTSEISIDCDRMEQTNSCENEKHIETNV
ncbi:rho guanine nucleotide exchange factor 3 isoform X4 [Anas acuta]|nr:rho guanine nucleotide exchange factor 3 isoform X3 [Anas platyrhynchos]XP_027323385.1 rho guanine nucleotide exchange factor 3 isoform X3 [Anas platyrhynchos]XP_027323386.1 rho guanine nucleotide exchange factor 3 isoform X3 [Anas platyrhynchos]|eukprot:XP_027323384.1 rho guanine nucleotide exchange factor 3 isoform X2 [Anas platyrhynchos]